MSNIEITGNEKGIRIRVPKECISPDALDLIEDFFLSDSDEKVMDTDASTKAHWFYWGGLVGNHDGRIEGATCTKCGFKHPTVIGKNAADNLYKFCPECGSKMVKERIINMSLAKKCDRCGCYYDERETKQGTGVAFINLSERNEIIDTWGVKNLCPKCMDQFKRWLYKQETYVQFSGDAMEKLINGEVGYATINDKLTISIAKFDSRKGRE